MKAVQCIYSNSKIISLVRMGIKPILTIGKYTIYWFK